MPSPEGICQQIHAALEHEPRINLHRYPIHLHCEDGTVTVEPPEEDTADEITDAVRLVLEKDPFVRADQIRVRTRGRVVTLEGLAPNRTIRDMAEFDVWYVFGIDRVVNELQVQA